MRIVSLVPSATETLLMWGIEPIAVTRFCEQPALRTVGGTKDPDVRSIVALAPDLVVMCDQENRREDADALAAAGVRVHAMSILSFADNATQLAALAAAVGLAAAPADPNADPGERSGEASPAPRLRAWIPIWKRPWMTVNGDTYGSTLLASIGIANIAAGLPERYPHLEPDAARALAPDVVLAPTEPYPFAERHRSVLEAVAPTVFVDGQDLFWWGARAGAARTRLSRALAGLHPATRRIS